MNPIRPAIFAISALALSGCFVPMERGRLMEARIQRIEVQNAEQERGLEEQRAAVRERIAKVDQKIREVQAKIDELNKAARRSGADLSVSLSRLQEEFARVKGDLEVAQHRLVEIDKSVGTLRTETDGRFAALKGAGALDTYEARQKASTLRRPDDKGSFFELARKEEQSGDKGVARELYEEYVRKWPRDAKAAEAGFHAGQLNFEAKRWREALLSYGKVAEAFPASEQAPDSLLGAAESMLALDMRDEGSAVLAQVVEKYPKSEAARRASARLAEVSPPRQPEKAAKPERKKPTARKR